MACDAPKNTTDTDIPNIKECVDTKDPNTVDWMKKAMGEHQPFTVIKYRYRTDGWAYQFTGPNRHLYDCQGTLLCVAKGKALDDCARQIANLNKAEEGVVIYAKKENMD